MNGSIVSVQYRQEQLEMTNVFHIPGVSCMSTEKLNIIEVTEDYMVGTFFFKVPCVLLLK